MHHGLPPQDAEETILRLLRDDESTSEWYDQLRFRSSPDFDRQRPPSDIKDIYFPDFIKHRDDEHYVDCGRRMATRLPSSASDGAITRKSSRLSPTHQTTENWPYLVWMILGTRRYRQRSATTMGMYSSQPTGDYSSHIGVGSEDVVCLRLDRLGFYPPPTYIKMDIEGAELEALWGARRTLKEHSPVLAICAYHTSDHLWQIPLLIHAIQPDYRLFFRRYAEGEWEIVWYAVPPERVK